MTAELILSISERNYLSFACLLSGSLTVIPLLSFVVQLCRYRLSPTHGDEQCTKNLCILTTFGLTTMICSMSVLFSSSVYIYLSWKPFLLDILGDGVAAISSALHIAFFIFRLELTFNNSMFQVSLCMKIIYYMLILIHIGCKSCYIYFRSYYSVNGAPESVDNFEIIAEL